MMYLRLTLALLASTLASNSALAQRVEPYTVPRTEYGHPDFQGVWAAAFLTRLERPAGVEALIASPEQAQSLAATIRSGFPAIQSDLELDRINELAMVKGEYRTSLIVEPKDGKMPFTQAGLEVAAWVERRNTQMFDHPEQRPLMERCMESLGYPPIRAIPAFFPRQILQTRDHVVIASEDAVGVRIIRLVGDPPPHSIRSVEGYSTGQWDGDTLVVQTTHLRAEDPARNGSGRKLLLSRNSKIRERFTRVSETELFYQFTIEDDHFYTQPWTGEFSMTRHDGRIYEFACHEGNYSMPNMLRGGQAEAARLAKTKRDRN
jgi:hypothetical protein